MNHHRTVAEITKGILNHDRRSLSKAITLVESTLPADQNTINAIFMELERLHKPPQASLRVGFTGSPGVGKSSLIESLGSYLTKELNKNVAVLVHTHLPFCVFNRQTKAVDPSSQRSGGSILGDKTRMPKLTVNPKAFIRPSPSRLDLGGVVMSSFDTIRLCEYAGYDVVIVETVGVGQSELMLTDLVDIFVLLIAPGAGDELQGIKKGITEIADLILVNKCDPPLSDNARLALFEYKSALKFQRPLYEDLQYTTKVLPVSALSSTGIREAWQTITDLTKLLWEKGILSSKRESQKQIWTANLAKHILASQFDKFLLQASSTRQNDNSGTLHQAAQGLLEEFLAKPRDVGTGQQATRSRLKIIPDIQIKKETMLGMDMPAEDFNHNQEVTLGTTFEHHAKTQKEESAEQIQAATEQQQAVEAPKQNEETTKPQTPAGDDSLSSKVLTPLVKEQLKFCSLLSKGLKRHPQAGPFLVPVDPVALGIPDYFTVITNPMDLSTIQRKLDAFEYETANQFADDVHLMLNNCFTYNKPETQVYQMGKALEKYFNNSFSKLPTELSVVQTDDFGKRRKSDSTPTRAKRDSITSRRTSTAPSVPVVGNRPKRSNPELTYCMTIWKELTKKSYLNISWPFLEPVDPIKLGIPDYPEIIKNPMDLSTVKKKLDASAYATSEEFEADIRLIFSNCYTYNGIESDVSKLGKELEAIFEKKLAARPAVTPNNTLSRIHDSYDEDSEKILAINKQIQALQQELNELLTKRRGQAIAPKPAPKSRSKPSTSSAESTLPSPVDDLTFEEKRQLSVDVNNLSPEKLGRVVEIIHNSMPYLQQQSGNSDVIELDMDTLDVGTMRQLQKYINDCKAAAIKKRKSTSAAPRPKKASMTGDGSAHAGGQISGVPAPALEEGFSSDDSSSSDDDI